MGVADFFDIADLKNAPTELSSTFKPSNIIAKGYPFWTLRGDTTSFLMLFFDCLATQMSGIGAMVYGIGFTHSFVYGHFMGGVGVSLLFGNVYYALQASKVAMRTGKMDTCAQPYGINTPGMFVKIFSVMAPCYYAALAAEGCGPFVSGTWADVSDCDSTQLDKGMTVAWNVACCANFVGGCIEFVGAFIAPMIVRNVPEPAFLVPICGIGATWLGYAPLAGIMASHFGHNPLVGFIPLLFCWLGFYSSPDTGPLAGKFLFGRAPPVLISCVVGIILVNIVNNSAYVAAFPIAAGYVGNGGIKVPDFSYFGSDYFTNYGSLSIIIGLSFTNFIGTFACNISARLGGDMYSPMEQMIIDGLGTMLGACFGSPLGTTVYIGHPTCAQAPRENSLHPVLFARLLLLVYTPRSNRPHSPKPCRQNPPPQPSPKTFRPHSLRPPGFAQSPRPKTSPAHPTLFPVPLPLRPADKKFGATRGYSVVTGLLWFIVGLAGLHGIMDALIPHEILLGSLVCVGFVIVKQTLEFTPARWYPAVAIGLCLCFSDYIVNLMGLTPDKDVSILSSGYVFISALWTFFFMMLTDRWFGAAAIVFMVMALFTTMGITHATKIGFVYDSTGHHFGGVAGTTETWKHVVTYFIAACVSLVMFGFQKMGWVLEPEPEDYRVIQRARYAMSDEPVGKESAIA